MDARRAKSALSWLVATPFHPQWLLARTNRKYLRWLGASLSGRILDIGCGHKAIAKYLPAGCDYTGVDYYSTAVGWYGSRPDIYAVSDHLPFPDNSFDYVLLLDVLEHVPSARDTMQEINRVLRNGCRLFIQLPFMYPIHDAPLDFCRWTEAGLDELFSHAGFQREETEAIGAPVETGVLLLNIALSKLVINAWNSRNPLFLLLIPLPFVIVVLNILAVAITAVTPVDRFMPFRYRLSAIKMADKAA